MNDSEIKKRLKKTGKARFVLYYHIFTDDTLNSSEKRAALVQSGVGDGGEDYMEGYATPIISAGAGPRALKIIQDSKKVEKGAREQAGTLLEELGAAK